MIYISCGDKDLKLARALREYLSQEGYTVWINDPIIKRSEPWAENVKASIMKCNVVIILLNNASLESKCVKQEVELVIEEAWQRGKRALCVAFDRNSIKIDGGWSYYLRRSYWVICDDKNSDWKKTILDVIAHVYGNEYRKQKKYEEYSELLKSDNTLYASEKLTEIIDLILNDLEEVMLPGERKRLLMELDRCLEHSVTLFSYDYYKRLDILRRISILPECTQKTSDVFYLACAVRLLYRKRQIYRQYADTMTGGDVNDEIGNTLPEPEPAIEQELFNELFKTALSSDNWQKNYTEEETDFILQTRKYSYERSELLQKEKSNRQEQESPDEKMETIARFIQNGNDVFELIGQDIRAADFLRCLITSYDRLRNYCDVVGARKISAECVGRIADLKQRLMLLREEIDTGATKAEKGIKALLGLTLPGSGTYDVFISHKKEDDDIAGYVYGFLKTNLKEVFFDKISLPEISRSEYRKAIMTALDHSKHFIVIVTQIETLQEAYRLNWVQREMEAFHTEIFEGRKKDSNFIILATDEVYNKVTLHNKSNIYIDWRNYTILKISNYRETLMSYIK